MSWSKGWARANLLVVVILGLALAMHEELSTYRMKAELVVAVAVFFAQSLDALWRAAS